MASTGMANNADTYMNFRVIRNNNSTTSNDGMYIGYSNSNSGHTRLFGGGATSGGLYIRGSGANDLTYGNNTGVIWHSANDGAGTGLDADLLDGQHGSYYLSANNFTGTLSNARLSSHVDIGGQLDIGVSTNVGVTYLADRLWISAHTTGQSDVPGNYYDIINLSASSSHGIQIASGYGANSGLIYIRTRSDNNSAPAGAGLQAWNKIWHNNNDGSGSGLDADTLDGYDSAESGASKILRSASNGYLKIVNWIDIAGTGLYSSTLGNHFHVDTEGYIARSGSTTESRIRLQTSNATTRGVLYSNSSNQVGFLNPATTGVCRYPRLAIFSGTTALAALGQKSGMRAMMVQAQVLMPIQ